MRASFLLLGEQPEERSGGSHIGLRSFVQSPLKELGVDEAVFAALWKRKPAQSADFLRHARLWAIYYLRSGKICDDVLELRLGPVRAGKLAVLFRGRRKSRYSNGTPHEIKVEGDCPLK